MFFLSVNTLPSATFSRMYFLFFWFGDRLKKSANCCGITLAVTDSLLIRGRTGAAIWKSGSVLDFSKILGVIGCSKVAHMLAPPGMHVAGNT